MFDSYHLKVIRKKLNEWNSWVEKKILFEYDMIIKAVINGYLKK